MEDVIDLEHWGRDQTTTPIPRAKTYQTRLWDGDGFDEKRAFNDDDVTGQQVLERYDRRPTSEFELLMLTRRGDLERVDLHQTISLRDKGPERFFAFRADRLFTFTVNGRRYPWGAPTITASLIRRLARIPDDHTLFLEKAETPDETLGDDSVVTLTGSGVETLSSRKAEWKLNVQGVLLTLASPFIAVKDALAQAGFDPNQGWIAILKRKGAPKQQVELCDTIDLRLPGIEKLRLTPAEINNGEAPAALRQDFALLEKDRRYLDARAFVWETFIDGGRRWLFLRPSSNGRATCEVARGGTRPRTV